MIDLHDVTARAAPIALAPIRASFGAGAHALLGAREDAVALVLDVIAGRVRARSGEVRVLGKSPRDPSVRRAIAHVPLDAALPDALRVDEALWIAAQIRHDAPWDGDHASPQTAAQRLDVLGLGALARRIVRTLSSDEARGVALAEAVTSSAKVLLVEEPFAMLDPRASSALASALRARARDGACVIVSTASVRDALDLADDVLTFDRGALVRRAAATDPLATAGTHGAALRAIVSDERALLAALAGEGGCASVDAEPGAVLVRGADATKLAAAVARAVLRSGVTLDALQADVAPLAELRAAIAGDAAAAYRAAFERARAGDGPDGPNEPPPEPSAAPPATPSGGFVT